MSSIQRDQALQMLKDVYDKVSKDYYDPTYHNISLDDRYKQAKAKIVAAQSLSEAFGDIAWMLDGLNDSHTFFILRRGLTWFGTVGKPALWETPA